MQPQPVTTSETRGIGEYFRYTKRLIDDIESAIADLTFRQDGGELVWAVDFTEIDAFVLPDERGGRTATDTALDIAVLERFFFGSGEVPPVVLLPPHRVELRNAEGFFQQESLVRFQNLVTRATVELQQLQSDKTFDELLRQLDGSPPAVEQARLETDLLNYLNAHAGALFLSITQVGRTPQGRLKELLQRARLVDLSSVVGRVVPPEMLDDDLVRDLTTAIYERRLERQVGRDGGPPDDDDRERLFRSSARDAMAVGYVGFANRHFEQQQGIRRRMLLLTRSEVVISEAGRHAASLGHARLDRFLRRAAAYRQAIVMPGGDIPQRIEDLRQRRRALELAIKALRPFAGPDAAPGEAGRADPALRHHVARLTALWQEAANLAVATVPWSTPGTPLLELMRNKDRLNDLIRKAAAQLAADINLNNAMLGFYEGEGRHRGGSTSFIDKPMIRGSERQGVLIWSRDTVSTIALIFYDPILARNRPEGQDGTRLLRRLLEARLRYEREDNRGDHALPESERQPRLVESCLASSFIEAVEGRWKTALIFAEMAANWPTHLDATPRHEALYMRAVTRRRAEGPTESSLRASLADLDAAAQDLRNSTGITEDPRYVLQQGICYFGLWEHVDGGKTLDVNAPTLQQELLPRNENIDRATALFDRARRLVEQRSGRSASTNRLMLDIANARCYSHIGAHGPDEVALRLYTELLRAMRDCQWDAESVPVSQLDTLVWTRFQLRGRLGATDGIAQEARLLARRFPQFQGHGEDKAVVEAHLREIGAALGVDFLAAAAETAA